MKALDKIKKDYPSHIIVGSFLSRSSKLYEDFELARARHRSLLFIEYTDEVSLKQEILHGDTDLALRFDKQKGIVFILRKDELVRRSVK